MITDQNRTRGFSMIELMIVVVIISILAAIAIPSYRQYVLKGHRSEATRALQDLASRQENYYFSNNEYTDNLADLGASASIAGVYFTVAIPSASSSDYEITATARGTQTQDGACTAFALYRSGAKDSTGTATSDTCWSGR
jgi:type IV pilus assembly protein PilE